MVVQLKEHKSVLEYQITSCQVLTYGEEAMTQEVIRYRKGQRWSGIDTTLTSRYGIQYKKEVSMLNSLVASAKRYGLKGCKISLDKNSYTAANKLTKQGISYIKTKRLLEAMDADGLITLYVGYYDTDNDVGVPSFFIPTEEYNDLWEGVDVSGAMSRKEDTIVIKDSVTKTTLPTRGFRGVAILREDLNKYNKLLANNKIEINGEVVHLSYKRVFHDSLKESGRYYTNGGFGTIEKEDRDYILINSYPTVELDYSAIHPNILYTMEGIVYNGNVYLEGKYREASKLCLLIMLFSKGRTEAHRAAFQKLREEYSYQQIVEICTQMEDIHSGISQHFYKKDLWKVLQHYDSCIATKVLTSCIERNIVALPYHDSFRVEKGYAEILKGMMYQAWRDVLGTTDNCSVVQK